MQKYTLSDLMHTERIALKLYLYYHLNTYPRPVSSMHVFNSAVALTFRIWEFSLCYCSKHKEARDRSCLALDWLGEKEKLTLSPTSAWNHLWWMLLVQTHKRLQTRSYQCPIKYYQYFWKCLSWHAWGSQKFFHSSELLIVILWPASTLRSSSPLDISNRRALRLKQMFILLDPKCIITHFVLMNFFPFLLLQFSRTSNWKYKK